MNQSTFEAEIEGCQACELREYCTKPFTPISSYSNIDLMVISERPSKEEEAVQTPYFDRHNQYVVKLIARIFHQRNVHYTYLVKCYGPTEIKLGKKKIEKCNELYLLREYDELEPKAILYLGAFF